MKAETHLSSDSCRLPSVTPVRLQLRRVKGFNLQALSRAANGLPAVNCARPSKWGNPWIVGLVACACADSAGCAHNLHRCATAAEAVAKHRNWILGIDLIVPWRRAPTLQGARLSEIRGRNLACFCALDAPCHADTLLELANPTGCDI